MFKRPDRLSADTAKRNHTHVKRCLYAIIYAVVFATSSASAQSLSDSAMSTDSPLAQGEQLFLRGSYAAAGDAFMRAQGLDLEEGIVGRESGIRDDGR